MFGRENDPKIDSVSPETRDRNRIRYKKTSIRLTDASSNPMTVFGTASIKVRPASSGKKKPKYVSIKALVYSSHVKTSYK